MTELNIVLPSKLKVIQEDAVRGVYEIEGLHPGYGYTLGNSLRRIILSSLPGAAVTAVKIEGADHEFASIAGIQEDVLMILLNLKKVRFKMSVEGPIEFQFTVKGAKEMTAKDIEVPGGLEVLTPNQHICSITDKGASITMTLTVERGLGFVARENLRKEKVDVGTIAIDAIFTPVRKASYEVEDMRVGDRTNYHRLRMSIETDGTIAPKEALEEAIHIMLAQLRSVLDLKHEAYTAPVKKESVAETVEMEASEGGEVSSEDDSALADVLKTRIDSLSFGTRTANALSGASIRTLGGLVQKTETDLMELEGFGSKSLDEVKEALTQFGLTLKV